MADSAQDWKLTDLIALCRRGDPEAFDQLIERYASRLYGLALHAGSSHHEAEDLVQEIFLRVVKAVRRYREEGRFESWLFRIAMNCIRDRQRKKRAEPSAQPIGQEEDRPDRWTDLPDTRPGPGQKAESRESAARLGAALSQLPEWEREAIVLRHFSQLSFAEMAKMLDCPINTALSRVHRGLRRLKTLMTEDE